MNARHLLCMFCIAALAAAGLSGCGGEEQAAAPGTEKPRVALIMKSLANEFFATMEKGAWDHHSAHEDEYDLVVQGIKDELDREKQVQLVEQMISQGVDAIVIAPADSRLLVPVCKQAQDEGIVVVNIDNKFDVDVLADQNAQIPFIGPDNRKGAKLVGDYLAKHLEPGAPVAIIEGVPTAFNAQQRKLGFEDAMNEAGMKIAVSLPGNWEMDKANQVVSGVVTEHPEIEAVLCANDSMALGAVSALRAAGKLAEIEVVGFDNISAVQELLEKGEVLATADQHADQLAVFGIEYALEMLAGASPEDRETPVDLITADAQ